MSTNLAATESASSSTTSSSPRLPPNEKPALPPQYSLVPPLATEATITHALRSLNGSTAAESHGFGPFYGSYGTIGPYTIRPNIPHYESPYARSNASTAPGSPRIPPLRQNSGNHTPRIRPHATTLDIPGMTRSKVSPDGHIPERDVASKLVIIMVGLPARGKSYITKKIERYLSWQQHSTRIFNVGNRRRVTATVPNSTRPSTSASSTSLFRDAKKAGETHVKQAAMILLNGVPSTQNDEPTALDLNDESGKGSDDGLKPSDEQQERVDHSAKFFDPKNESAAKLRDQIALDTLDELLDYLLHYNGAVGILDATNSTLQRRKLLVEHVKEREPKLGILFVESICNNKDLLEANMRLKLSGPDYRNKDPAKSLEDFKARVKAYESAYEPLGEYEEKNGLQYIQLIDVGRKVVHYRLTGFLSSSIASYLTTFNLSPRQIWITRHGQSTDNVVGKLGGDSNLTERGHYYGLALYNFITAKRREWLIEQESKIAGASFPPLPGDHTPPYPEPNQDLDEKNFCVWTSMLKRSAETAEYFEADDDYDVKAWEMLNELNAGTFEGMTYDEIAIRHPGEYAKRHRDKLQYIYPGVGGEGYLQVINRLREMVREVERVSDHVLIISHRSVCRVLMAYFMDLTRDHIADLDVPLGMLFAIHPKPYGMEFHAYKYNEPQGWFDEVRDYKPQQAEDWGA